MANIQRPPVYRVTAIQLLVLCVLGGISGFLEGAATWSVLAGGLTAIVPHLYFTVHAFRYSGARSAALIAGSFYRGEIGKFLLTLCGFALTFVYLPNVDGLAVFGGYGAMLLLQWYLVARALGAEQQ